MDRTFTIMMVIFLVFGIGFNALYFLVIMPNKRKAAELKRKQKEEARQIREQHQLKMEKEKMELEVQKQKLMREAELEAQHNAPSFCQYCGAKIPAKSLSCPGCGAKCTL